MAYKKKSYGKKKRTYKRKSYAPKRKALKRVIRKEITRAAEKKTIQAFNYGRTIYVSGSANFPQNVIDLGPSSSMVINQGTGQGSRIGNKIQTQSLKMRGTITPLCWNTTTNPNPRPLQVKMVFFYDKSDPNALPAVGTNFFQDGNSFKGFQDDLVDMWAPFNTDRYRICATRTFKLGYAAYGGTASSAANQTAHQVFANNDFKYNCNFNIDLTKMYPKKVIYNDTGGSPTSRGLFVLFYFAAADGSFLTNTWEMCSAQWMQTYTYTDL